MKISQQLLQQHSSEEFLKLARKENNKNVSNGIFRLQLLNDELGIRTNPRTGVSEKVVVYHFIDPKTKMRYKYAVPIYDKNKKLHYLIKRLGVLPENTIIDIQYVSKGIGGYIDVQVVQKPKISKQPEANKISTDKLLNDEPEISETTETTEITKEPISLEDDLEIPDKMLETSLLETSLEESLEKNENFPFSDNEF
ncbi:MAG: hypothetical protein QW051_01205 [Candidatus Aenigmatarchaeota archaeon]